MKTLETTFRKGGFDYALVERVGDVAIYKQTKGDREWFEVGRIRRNKSRFVFGVQIEASESWPSSEEWGIRAYTCQDLRRAKARVATLIPPDS